MQADFYDANDLPAPHNRHLLATTLATFGATVLREVCQPAVMAMFRLAIAEVERSPEVAETLNRRSAKRGALAALLAQAQARGTSGPGDPGQTMEQFFSLLWGDLMLSRLLRAAVSPNLAETDRRAHAATEAFLAIYGRR